MNESFNRNSITRVYCISYRDQLYFGLEVPGIDTSHYMTHTIWDVMLLLIGTTFLK